MMGGFDRNQHFADSCEMSKTASTSFFGKIGWREI
jgi:hypothetical protein